jgi:hypothetical protein
MQNRGHRVAHRSVCCLIIICLALACPHLIRAQTVDAATKQKLLDAAQSSFPLPAKLNVADNVSIEAVLLPERVCREVFGKEISENYATVELTVSNRSHEAALIVQSIFIDYSNWALSGSFSKDVLGTTQVVVTSPNTLQPWQTATLPNQISSVEYRIARGQLLDRQPWSFRNVLMRSLEAVGSVATAYVFTTTNTDVIRGVGAFTGHVVPAMQTLLPDGTIGQMNRISDVGFQVNKLIPKDSSDIVVAFFPIDRFLTPGLKRLFLKSPALFFATSALLLDPEAQHALAPIVASTFNSDVGAARTSLAQLPAKVISGDAQGLTEQQKNILRFMNAVSLDNIKVVVGGIMSVDVSTVPASIVSVDLDGGNSSPNNWSKGAHVGSIKGSYLLNGTPILIDPPKDVQISAVLQGSSDSELRFQLQLPENFLTTGTKTLAIKVIKKSNTNKDIESMVYELEVPVPK